MYYKDKMTSKIRKNDNVKVLLGKDSGKTATVLSVESEKGKILLKGINMYKKHVKPNKKYPSGGIIDINKPIDISNVILVCPACGKTTRVSYEISNGNKFRICKKCKKSVESGEN